MTEQVQLKLTEWGLLDPAFEVTNQGTIIRPSVGKWGSQSQSAWEKLAELFNRDPAKPDISGINAPEPIKNSGDDVAFKLAKYYQDRGWFLARGNDVFNFVGLEGLDPGWKKNGDLPDFYNDLFVAFQVEFSGACKIVGKWKQTTEPGRRWTERPMNPGGAARIFIGSGGEGCQYKAWQVGTHGQARPHEALIQTGGEVLVCRDLNKDYKRTGDRIDKGMFGINLHAGEGETIGAWSAGCQVIQGFANHEARMKLAKRDRRYKANNRYTFIYAVVDGAKIFG